MQRRVEAHSDVWFTFARRDLGDAVILRASGSLGNACFLAQQAGENAIKGALRAAGREFPYSHDLDVLGGLLPGALTEAANVALPELTRWAFTTRYPGIWPPPLEQDADLALRQAALILAEAVAMAGEN